MMAELQGVYLVLKAWKNNPKLTKREIGFWYYPQDDNQYDRPFNESDILSMKKYLLKNNPTSYYTLFPKDDLANMRD
jgi:hypothetical protein